MPDNSDIKSEAPGKDESISQEKKKVRVSAQLPDAIIQALGSVNMLDCLYWFPFVF